VPRSKPRRVRRPTADALLARVALAQVEGRAPSTAVGVVRAGALVWQGLRGTLDGTPDGPVPTIHTQYRIGSITKTFTAVLVLQLRDAGALDLDDRIDRYLDDTPFGDVRIRDLLAHAGGLAAEPPVEWWERIPGVAWPELAAGFGDAQRLGPAGRFHYSNIGYAMLGELVARLTGVSWYEALRGRLLDPLDLYRTTDRPAEPAAPGLAVHPLADVLMTEAVQDHGAMAPAGQLWSTVADLARWSAFLAGDTAGLLDPTSLLQMRQSQSGVDVDGGYGLGLQLIPAAGRRLVGHGGSVPGFVASIVVDPERGTAAVELANTTAGRPFCGVELLDLLERAEPTVVDAWTPAVDLPAEWADLVGLWHWGAAPYLIRLCGSDRLQLTPAVGDGRVSSFLRTGDGWTGVDGYWAGEPLTAVGRSDGSVDHLDLGSFVFTRLPYDPETHIPGGVSADPWGIGDGTGP
jgi:CubicO group peptidase (beta-lactamase class C family)